MLAEIDLSILASINHEDALERGGGPNPDDWAGLPFNESGRAKALSFAVDHFHAGAHLLVPDPVAYRGRAASLRMWAVPDPITGSSRVDGRGMGNARR